MRKWSTALAGALMTLFVSAAVASAANAPAKKTPPKKAHAAAVKPKPICQLAENTRTVPCTPNPLFSKDVCNDYMSQVEALAAPGTAITTAGNKYGPNFNVVGCYYAANGISQRFYFTVSGAKSQSEAQKGFQRDYQESVTTYTYTQCPPSEPEPTAPGVVKTTIGGFEAFTIDQCAPIDNSVIQPTIGRLEVLAGNADIFVGGGGAEFGSLTSSQLISFVKELIAKYR
ncbi:MAG TPA: hypothetical protein VG652_04360 [Gaiellaceae bacterium]|nr:hypothetical protein [Gaiellaceae bacterium]